jgi:uncharacterized membrane protein YeaQ/YmgE (transglycosylase-associated protein family)
LSAEPALPFELDLRSPLFWCAFGATLQTKVMERCPIILTIGAGLLGFLAGEMLLTDPAVHVYLGEVSHYAVTLAGLIGAAFVVLVGRHLSRRVPEVLRD